MRIGILQTGHAPDEMKDEIGDYASLFVQLLDRSDFIYDVYNVLDNEFPEDVGQADGWLITGSKHGVYENHPWIPPLEKFILSIRDSGLPLVGVCFGHQIIAQALGGTVEKYSGGWSIGSTQYKINDEDFTLNAWHQDQVTKLPDGAKVLGSSDFCAHAALLYGENIFTIQPHPEFTSNVIGGLIKYRSKGIVPVELVDEASQKLPLPSDNDRISTMMRRIFLKGRDS